MSDVRLPQHGRDHRVGGSDPIPGLGSGGSGLPSFAMTGGPFTVTDAPLLLDTPDTGSLDFTTTDATYFDSSGGLARILAPGMYVIAMFQQVQMDGAPVADQRFDLNLKFQGDIGYGIEFPNQALTPNTSLPFPAGTSDDYEIAGQRIFPISLTSSTTFPLEIQPSVTVTDTGGSMIVSWLGLWGFRVGDNLNAFHSD